jgi:hypothetical protein
MNTSSKTMKTMNSTDTERWRIARKPGARCALASLVIATCLFAACTDDEPVVDAGSSTGATFATGGFGATPGSGGSPSDASGGSSGVSATGGAGGTVGDADASDGSDAPSAGGVGGTGGSSGSTASGGSGGFVDPVEECRATVLDECHECSCEGCWDVFVPCLRDPYCLAMMECANESNCRSSGECSCGPTITCEDGAVGPCSTESNQLARESNWQLFSRVVACRHGVRNCPDLSNPCEGRW